MEKKAQYKFILLCNLIVWSVFSFCDFLDELGHMNVEILLLMLFLCPVLVFIIYMELLHSRADRIEFTWKQHILFCLRFFEISAVVAFLITLAACHNMWIVRQSQLGQYDLFNGFEYGVYGFDFVMISAIEFIVYGIVKGCLKKKKGRL